MTVLSLLFFRVVKVLLDATTQSNGCYNRTTRRGRKEEDLNGNVDGCADGDHDVDPRHIPRPLRQRSSYSLISWPTTENTTTTNNNKMARRNNSRVFDVQLPVQSSSMSLQSMELHNADDSAEWA